LSSQILGSCREFIKHLSLRDIGLQHVNVLEKGIDLLFNLLLQLKEFGPVVAIQFIWLH